MSRSTRARHRALLTTGLAAAGIAGSALMATPASAAPMPLSGDPAAQAPVVSLTADRTSVTVGSAITFHAAEKAVDGTALAGARATFQVSTKHGWESFGTHTLDSSGATTFTFRPNYDHHYRVLFAAATGADGAAYAARLSASTVVRANLGPAVVAAAAREKGKPYVFDTAGPNTFDCSGLVKYVFAQFGIDLPHHADDMKHYGERIPAKDAKPGDLVFVFSGSYAHHVAIYAGNGTWWEAPHTGANVRLVKIWSTHIEFRRIR